MITTMTAAAADTMSARMTTEGDDTTMIARMTADESDMTMMMMIGDDKTMTAAGIAEATIGTGAEVAPCRSPVRPSECDGPT